MEDTEGYESRALKRCVHQTILTMRHGSRPSSGGFQHSNDDYFKNLLKSFGDTGSRYRHARQVTPRTISPATIVNEGRSRLPPFGISLPSIAPLLQEYTEGLKRRASPPPTEEFTVRGVSGQGDRHRGQASPTRPAKRLKRSPSAASIADSYVPDPSPAAERSKAGDHMIPASNICQCCPKKPRKFETSEELR
jgi:hypothetical protein